MNFKSLSVIYSSRSPSVATISFTTRCAVSDASVALFVSINFTSLVNQSVVVSMLSYFFPVAGFFDLSNFTIKSIATDFYGSLDVAINSISP
jgi:hypothetical protein